MRIKAWIDSVNQQVVAHLIRSARSRGGRRPAAPAPHDLPCLAETLEFRLLLSGAVSFATPPPISMVGVNPDSVAVADVNGDGKPDLVVASRGQNNGSFYVGYSVSVMFGTGDGMFGAPQTFAVGAGAKSVVVADVNGDHHPDIIVANYNNNSVSILLGNGNGTFEPQQTIATDAGPDSVAVADVSGDGKPDLIVGTYTGADVDVLLGNGNGTFQSKQTVSTGGKPYSVAVANFNTDGKPDLAVMNRAAGASGIGVLLNNGNGTFMLEETFSTPYGGAITVADVNGDGSQDLIAGYGGEGMNPAIYLLTNDGDGLFQSPQTLATGRRPFTTAVADVNGDGHDDIITSNYLDNSVSVLLANGDGTFAPQQTFAAGMGPAFVTAADLNGDKMPDLVAVNTLGGTISVLRNQASSVTLMASANPGAFGSPVTFTATVDPAGALPVPAGSVTFFADSTSLGDAQTNASGVATLTTSMLPMGTSTITATYNGDVDYTPSTSAPLMEAIAAGASVTQVTAPTATTLLGSSITFTATVTSTPAGGVTPTGTVTFFDGATQLGSPVALMDGVAMLTTSALTVGNHSITASYAPDANYSASTSAPFSEFVGGTGANVTVSAPVAEMTTGMAIIFSATVTGTPGLALPTGTVEFFDGTASLGSGTLNASGIATFRDTNLSAGPHMINAVYSGDATYSPVPSPNFLETVNVILPETIGALDPNFGVGGVAAHDVGQTAVSDVAVQSDGKSVVFGTGGSAGSQSLVIARYNADGTLDTNFGTNGVVTTSFDGENTTAAGAASLPNGDFLVAATATMMTNGQPAGSQFALAEYTPAGALDLSFGGGAGFALTSFSTVARMLSNDVAHSLAVTSGGEIFVGGATDAAGHGQDFAIAAYNSNGALATSFGGTGKVTLDFSGGNDAIASLVVQHDGRVLAAGSTTAPGTGVGAVAMARFLRTGALDSRFGKKGQVVMDVRGIDDAATSVALAANRSIIIGGYSATGSAATGTLSADFLLLRYTSAGKLDRTFGNHGVVITSFNQPAAVTRVLVDADGTIVASGKTTASLTNFVPGELDVALARYTIKGQLDTTFNGTGRAVINLATATVTSSLSPLSAVQKESPAFRVLAPADAASDLTAAFSQFVTSSQGVVATTQGGELLDVGNSGLNTVEALIVANGLDLVASVIGIFPKAVLGGGKGTAKVQVQESGTNLASGTFTIDLFTSPDTELNAGQPPFATLHEKIKLKHTQKKVFSLKFVYPSSIADGDYYVLATIATGSVHDLNVANNTAPSSTPVDIAAPFVQLAGKGLVAPVFNGSRPATVSFTVTNNGNVSATTLSSVQFLASTDGTLGSAISIVTIPVKFNLRAGASKVLRERVSLKTPLPANTYHLLALLDPANVFGDAGAAGNLVVSANTFVVS